MPMGEREHQSDRSKGELVDRESVLGRVILLLSRDIDFYRSRTFRAVLIYGGFGTALTLLAIIQDISDDGRYLVAVCVLLGAVPTMRIVRTSTVRSKYVKLVRQESLVSSSRSDREWLHLSPVTLGKRLELDSELESLRRAPSVTRQWVLLIWLAAIGFVVILADPFSM